MLRCAAHNTHAHPPARAVVLDGEAVAVDRETGKILPFQVREAPCICMWAFRRWSVCMQLQHVLAHARAHSHIHMVAHSCTLNMRSHARPRCCPRARARTCPSSPSKSRSASTSLTASTSTAGARALVACRVQAAPAAANRSHDAHGHPILLLNPLLPLRALLTEPLTARRQAMQDALEVLPGELEFAQAKVRVG